MALITLLTDFGTRDEYAGVMKGVILSLNPSAVIVDITHHIDPQDIVQAGHALRASYRYFPGGTVHVAVVDPGVGGDRAIVAARAGDYRFLAPDNGILSLLDAPEFDTVVRVENSRYFLDSVSQTFHGRDIFAPVAAHMAAGLDMERLGPPLSPDRLVRLERRGQFDPVRGEISGTVVSADRFGNLITDIDLRTLADFLASCGKSAFEIRVGSQRLRSLSRCYAQVAPQRPLAIAGSRGYLEIAVNCGSASRYFGVGKGDTVTVVIVENVEK
ncbi:hypothetical protein DENIS_2479 [Desulfonema ishimotonii]|uniref:SAM-dependent chlorinase/fluorinase n=1 Tax=Desulfonema ishimotonii TaxID=45657 RepID=A0A401FX11_9BACT|nr:SAM-dependent chlorinase/fluorinase [Desulfonema ishimotonii]GBC61517.1 hypothetical protein DENIS_2479 [Desulfonema ishimotonii]